ncbi:hypothetical protein WA1_37085 [Scytonema hofmannii PCC 7110]|uniref:DUF3298 domain-containing protein n=1 Tax=Scytonema hofmannii PCC 7110 TaxID=128403 RepID=A0A139X137_9CYAN|nr:hypothetical protein [Scytonema hofmannii]KYC38398.1 hypothetical protein WA1_37085 [Scytonema hofmannii PCC 7110]
MNTIAHLLSVCAFSVSALTAMSAVSTAQTTPKPATQTQPTDTNTTPKPATQTQPTDTNTTPKPATQTQPTDTNTTKPQQNTNSQLQQICSYNTVEGLLPPPSNQQKNSPLSYLAQQGFVQNAEGAWVCYANDEQKPGRYYTLFKVQQINGALIATSFLDQGTPIQEQGDRTVELFMKLIQNHTKANTKNQESIQKYLSAFVSLVEQGKVQPSRRGYLFDQPSRGLVLYHPVTGGDLQGTGITININAPQNLVASPAS